MSGWCGRPYSLPPPPIETLGFYSDRCSKREAGGFYLGGGGHRESFYLRGLIPILTVFPTPTLTLSMTNNPNPNRTPGVCLLVKFQSGANERQPAREDTSSWPLETATRRWYSWNKKQWMTGRANVRIAPEKFAEGNMRIAQALLASRHSQSFNFFQFLPHQKQFQRQKKHILSQSCFFAVSQEREF